MKINALFEQPAKPRYAIKIRVMGDIGKNIDADNLHDSKVYNHNRYKSPEMSEYEFGHMEFFYVRPTQPLHSCHSFQSIITNPERKNPTIFNNLDEVNAELVRIRGVLNRDKEGLARRSINNMPCLHREYFAKPVIWKGKK